MSNNEKSFVFTEEELQDINEIRKGFEEATDRERFLIKQALAPYFGKNKKII